MELYSMAVKEDRLALGKLVTMAVNKKTYSVVRLEVWAGGDMIEREYTLKDLSYLEGEELHETYRFIAKVSKEVEVQEYCGKLCIIGKVE